VNDATGDAFNRGQPHDVAAEQMDVTVDSVKRALCPKHPAQFPRVLQRPRQGLDTEDSRSCLANGFFVGTPCTVHEQIHPDARRIETLQQLQDPRFSSSAVEAAENVEYVNGSSGRHGT
jgi:hypothetical protein